ncbi:MAG TPA: YihY/virulence factor BrkB family protein [Acidimicrobiia bacterium]|jgi:membrane protein
MGGRRGKKGEKKRGLVDRVVVPVGSAVVLSTAAIHSVLDRRHHNGTESEDLPDPEEATKGGLLDRLAQRFPWLEPVAAVQRRYSEVGGNFLAAALTFNAFLSLFPLMLVGVAVLGYIAAGSETDLALKIVTELGLKGQAAELLTDTIHAAENSRQAASIVGLAGLLWSGLGLVGALQYIYNAVWQVNDRGLKDKAVGLAWLAGASLLFVASAAVTTVLRWLPGPVAPLGIVVGFGVSFLLWLWTARVLPNKQVPWRDLVPGALFGATGLELLKLAGAYWVPKMVASSSALYGSLGVVFAILAWLAFFGRLVVYSAVINVVVYERKAGTVTAVLAVPSGDTEHVPVANRAGRLVATR